MAYEDLRNNRLFNALPKDFHNEKFEYGLQISPQDKSYSLTISYRDHENETTIKFYKPAECHESIHEEKPIFHAGRIDEEELFIYEPMTHTELMDAYDDYLETTNSINVGTLEEFEKKQRRHYDL